MEDGRGGDYGRYVGDTYGERLRVIKEDWAVVQRASKQHEKGQEEAQETQEEAVEGEEQGEGSFGRQRPGRNSTFEYVSVGLSHLFVKRKSRPHDVLGLDRIDFRSFDPEDKRRKRPGTTAARPSASAACAPSATRSWARRRRVGWRSSSRSSTHLGEAKRPLKGLGCRYIGLRSGA